MHLTMDSRDPSSDRASSSSSPKVISIAIRYEEAGSSHWHILYVS